jgi:molecular chaperone IbpA
VQVTGASLENGLLVIELLREIPEALKARRIEIGSPDRSQTAVIENAQVSPQASTPVSTPEFV